MKISFTGFNLYKQISKTTDLIVQDFTEFEYESFENIIFTHTYAAIKTNNHLFFTGKIIKQPDINEKENIKKVQCLDNNILLLYKTGKLCKTNLITGETTTIPTFANVESTESLNEYKDYIIDIACGTTINVAVSNEGRIFNIPNKLDYNGKKIKQIVTGREHCLILDTNGDVYSFGSGSRGQLGLSSLEDELNPKLIEALAGVKIIKVAAGGWHSCALSVSGDLYSWGWNSNGQLALPHKKDISVIATPQPVCLDDIDCDVRDVSCGTKHTVILIDNWLYGAGWNKYKQLGKLVEDNIYEMKLLKDYHSDKIISLQCGPWCTAVIIE